MKIADFETLKKLTKNGLIKYRIKDDLYHKAIIDSDIPFKPGVYLFYAVKGEREIKLLYIGKYINKINYSIIKQTNNLFLYLSQRGAPNNELRLYPTNLGR